MRYVITDDEAKKAKFPHEIFLINLVTNHILLFVGLLGMMKTYPILTAITPSISFVVIGYIMLRSRSIEKNASWFIHCHWQVCVRRSKFFIGILMLMGVGIAGLILSVDGNISALRPGHYAVGGITILPTMVSILVLIVMESDAMHQAKIGRLPNWVVEKYPNPDAITIEEPK